MKYRGEGAASLGRPELPIPPPAPGADTAAIRSDARSVAVSPLATVFAYMMSWSYNERMKLWLEDFASAVDELQESMEDLTDTPAFVDAVVHATRAAQATHQQEKLDALRNGVLNSVAPDAPNIDEQARFFRLVEEFTPAHLRLLKFLDDPGAMFDANGIERPDYYMGGKESGP